MTIERKLTIREATTGRGRGAAASDIPTAHDLATEIVADRLTQWTASRRALQEISPGRGLCFICGGGTLAGRGPVIHVVHGLFAHDVCRQEPM